MTNEMTEPDDDDTVAEVEFPISGEGKQVVALTRTASFRAWAGGPEDLKRLARVIESALHREFVVLRDQNNSEYPGEGAIKRNRRLAQGMKLSVAAYARGGVERRSGDLAAILAELDPRDIDGMRIGNYQSALKAPTGYPVIDLTIGAFAGTQKKDPHGPRLRVSGGNRNWVSGTLDVISDELSARNPAWSIFLTGWTLVLVTLGIVGGAFGILVAVTRPTPQLIGTYLTLAMMVWLGVLLGTANLLPRLFPPFEVVPTGDKDKGRRVLWGVVSLVSFALAVAGVVLPFILPA